MCLYSVLLRTQLDDNWEGSEAIEGFVSARDAPLSAALAARIVHGNGQGTAGIIMAAAQLI